MRAAAPLLCVVWTAIAGAEPVDTGAPHRVIRDRDPVAPVLVFVEPTRGIAPDLSLIGVAGALVPGDEYDVLDGGGYAAHVRVINVERTDRRCPGFFYQRGRARVLESHHEVDVGRAVAVGPALAPRRAAQLLYWGDGDGGFLGSGAASRRPIPQPPPPGLAPTLIQLVDLDGDRVPELARYLYSCALGTSQAWSGKGRACFDDWTRAPRGWRVTAHVEFSCD